VLGKGVDLLEDDRVSPPNARLDGDDVRTASIEDPEAPTDTSTGGAGSDRIVGGRGDDIVDAGEGDDTLYGAEGDDILIGGSGGDGYVYLPGDGDDVIIDLSGAPDVDELVLAGGIEPGDVRVTRLSTDDLLLTFADGSIRVCGYFASPHTGIERVLFDHAPPWTREDIELRAIDQVHAIWPDTEPDWHDASSLVLGAEWQDGASAHELF
jgi:Ca2+-binding RTX toxin-like protein